MLANSPIKPLPVSPEKMKSIKVDANIEGFSRFHQGVMRQVNAEVPDAAEGAVKICASANPFDKVTHTGRPLANAMHGT